MTYDIEKATRSHVRSQANHEEYIRRELRYLVKSLKIQVWEFIFRKVWKLNYERNSLSVIFKGF